MSVWHFALDIWRVEFQGLIVQQFAMMKIDNETSREECLIPTTGESYGGVDVFEMDEKTSLQAHRHVLFNCELEVVENFKK